MKARIWPAMLAQLFVCAAVAASAPAWAVAADPGANAYVTGQGGVPAATPTIARTATATPIPAVTAVVTPTATGSATPMPREAWTIDDTIGFIAVSSGDLDDAPGSEIVGGGADGKVYVYRWDGSAWLRENIDETGKEITDVEIGDANNDGRNEVLVAARYDPAELHAYEWDGVSWSKKPVTAFDEPAGWGGIEEVRIGDVNGDGANEVVVALGGVVTTEGGLYVYRWTEAAWSELYHDTGLRMRTLAVGNADNSGRAVIVAATDLEPGALHQYKWNAGGFERTVMDSGRLASVLAVGDTDNDGKNEVVAGSDVPYLYSYSWDAQSGWSASLVSEGKCANRAIHVLSGGGIVTTDLYDGSQSYQWDGAAWRRVPIQEDVLYAEDSALADADSDGTPELIVAGRYLEFSGGLRVYALPMTMATPTPATSATATPSPTPSPTAAPRFHLHPAHRPRRGR